MLDDKIHAHFRFRELFDHVVLLTAVAVIYVGLAKLSLALASIHPSATPTWLDLEIVSEARSCQLRGRDVDGPGGPASCC